MSHRNEALRAPSDDWNPSRHPGDVPAVPGRHVSSDVKIDLSESACEALLTAEAEQAPAVSIAKDDPANRARMVRANLGLVVAIAANYSGRGLPLADLIEQGNIGLRHAVEGFSPVQDAPFSTHASWWIKHAMRRSLRNVMPS